jgi:single-stranded DNA-binding protein
LEDEKKIKNPNQIYLNGFICKRPIYRTTPFGREITDILLAVNRPYNKSDYIPCIAWGRNARFSEKLAVGDNIKVWGRIQSRTYQKKLETGEVINKVAYEVSVSKMEIAGKEKDTDDDDSGDRE